MSLVEEIKLEEERRKKRLAPITQVKMQIIDAEIDTQIEDVKIVGRRGKTTEVIFNEEEFKVTWRWVKGGTRKTVNVHEVF